VVLKPPTKSAGLGRARPQGGWGGGATESGQSVGSGRPCKAGRTGEEQQPPIKIELGREGKIRDQKLERNPQKKQNKKKTGGHRHQHTTLPHKKNQNNKKNEGCEGGTGEEVGRRRGGEEKK